MTERGKEVPPWLEWTRQIAAIAQTGVFFKNNPYDTERYEKLQRLAAEILSFYGNGTPEKLQGELTNSVGYATPKVDVRAAVIQSDKILLVRERIDGKWCLPGGWADVGDVPSESAARELFEESGFRARVTKLIGVFDANRDHAQHLAFHAYKLLFLFTEPEGSFTPSTEILEADYFSLSSLPELSKGRTNREQLEECFRHYQDPNRLTYFD